MTSPFAQLRKRIFSISPREVTFERRGFRGQEVGAQQRLEQIGHTFLDGYHAALLDLDPRKLAARLSAIEPGLRGFAYEGASMALALMDHLVPRRKSRWEAFLVGPGSVHIYMVYIGMGWALARLPWRRWRIERSLERLDPLLRWLAIDGYGFHQGYFHWPRHVEKQVIPRQLSDDARRIFDQGLGRSLWFVDGADVVRIPATIASFSPSRHADLWSGVGLACTYAGRRNSAELEILREAAGAYQPQLAQGAAFAAKARQRADNILEHTESACSILCGMSAEAAAEVTDIALADLPVHGPESAYEIWRQQIQAQFTMKASKD